MLSRRALLTLATLLVPSNAFAGGKRVSTTVVTIARSKNDNVVNYDVNTKGDRIDTDEPLSVYWVMLAEDGRREGLTWLERKLAYGYRLVGKVRRGGFRLQLVSFAKRTIVVRLVSGRPRAEVRIDGKRAELDRIYVKTKPGGVKPQVLYVDLFGRDLKSRARVQERLQP